MTYLVSGGAGFIGGHVAEALLKRGDRTVVIDNFNDYYDPAIKRRNAERLAQYDNCVIIEGDIREAALVDRLFAEQGITHVAHLAAMAGVRESVQQARLYMDVNVTGTLNLLEASKAAEYRSNSFSPQHPPSTAKRRFSPSSRPTAPIVRWPPTRRANAPPSCSPTPTTTSSTCR